MGVVTVGLDVGQRRDPTALCVADVERPPDSAGSSRAHHLVRHLERLPLGTPYPAVAARVATVCAGIAARTGDTPRLFVDATGVGTPLVDVLRAAGVLAVVLPVYFTHGDRRVVTAAGDVRLGKAWLVSRLQALLQTRLLHLAQSAEARALAQELLGYEIRVEADANDVYGAFRTGAHDDLVTALGLATQEDQPAGAGVLDYYRQRLGSHRPV